MALFETLGIIKTLKEIETVVDVAIPVLVKTAAATGLAKLTVDNLEGIEKGLERIGDDLGRAGDRTLRWLEDKTS